MYRLTPRMLQRLKRDFKKYHELFSGDRCSGWELEELIVVAIRSDTQAHHHVVWREGGHDDMADIVVRTNGDMHPIQIKSGRIKKDYLTLSGHRLGRFEGDLGKITSYLNKKTANIMTIPYKKVDDKRGRKHIYQVSYVNIQHLTGLKSDRWQKPKTTYEQTNDSGVIFSLRPSMSWQIWWKIPIALIQQEREMVID